MPTYHEPRSAVAAAGEPAIRREISEIAAKVQSAAAHLTDADRQFLKDLQRGDRYRWRGIVRLLELAAQCPEDSDAFALADRFRALIDARRPRARITVAMAIEQETRAQGEADLVEVQAALAQNDIGILARCEHALLSHRAKLDTLIECVQTRRLQLAGARA